MDLGETISFSLFDIFYPSVLEKNDFIYSTFQILGKMPE
jgi:hypothetical protein